MQAPVCFVEKQGFRQWWMWAILLGTNLLTGYGLYSQVALNKPFGNNPASNEGLWVVNVFIWLLTAFLFSMRLHTRIKDDGIYVRFIPLHRKYKHYAWEQLQGCYVRQYRPLAEYGGWGIRYGFSKYGKALNVSGNMGLQLVFADGSKLLIGTQKPEELQEVINKFWKKS